MSRKPPSRLRFLLHPVTLLLVSAFGIVFLWKAEHTVLTVPFATAVVALAAAIFFMLSRRLAFSVYAAWLLVGALTVVSAAKYKMKGFSFHFYDTLLVLRDTEVLRFLFSSYLTLVGPVLLLVALAGAAAWWLYRLDRPVALGARWRSLPLALAGLALPLTFPAEANEHQRYFYYLQGRHASAFFVSLLDLAYIFAPSDLEKRLAALPPEPGFADTVDCGAGPRPDLFAVLEESHTDPRNFPELAALPGIAKAMDDRHGRLQPLHVETFGGGTWISAFSFMTGLSSTDFGWRSPYLTMSMENRIKGALPEVLRRCGYRTVAILPLNYTFVNEGPFLSSIGFETVLDMKAIGAPTYHLRDRFYFDAAEKVIAEHRRTDRRPLFLFMETMFPHSPYEERLEADTKVPGEPFSIDAGINEYMRRMLLARADFAAFADRRDHERAAHPSVLMSFGDHQSFATQRWVEQLAGPNVMATPASLAYRTFYSVTGGAAPASAEEPVDIAFLGLKLLQAAGIPGSPQLADLDRIRAACHGFFYSCPDRGAVDRHLRRRIDAGTLKLDLGEKPATS